MTNPLFNNEPAFEINKNIFKEDVLPLAQKTAEKFGKILRFYGLFNWIFFLLISIELLYFFSQLSVFIQSFTLAVHLGFIFATIFCYFTLHMYAYTYKLEKCLELQSHFIETCKTFVREPEDMPEHHEFVADACCQLASEIDGIEYTVFTCPRFLFFLSSSFERLNCRYFWQDCHEMKELLLKSCVEEFVKIVRLRPTDLESHAKLGNAYVMLSGLYIDPRGLEGFDEERWIPSEKYTESFQKKFRFTAERAIEEFKILSDYAPDDPWVHAQLAYSYRDLQMPREEIKEYEILLNLCPGDKETLFKLGKLYFEQGENAKGLQVYHHLKDSNYTKAESLMRHYDVYSAFARS